MDFHSFFYLSENVPPKVLQKFGKVLRLCASFVRIDVEFLHRTGHVFRLISTHRVALGHLICTPPRLAGEGTFVIAISRKQLTSEQKMAGDRMLQALNALSDSLGLGADLSKKRSTR